MGQSLIYHLAGHKLVVDARTIKIHLCEIVIHFCTIYVLIHHSLVFKQTPVKSLCPLEVHTMLSGLSHFSWTLKITSFERRV